MADRSSPSVRCALQISLYGDVMSEQFKYGILHTIDRSVRLGEDGLKRMGNVRCSEHSASGRQEDVMKTTRTFLYVSQRAWRNWCSLSVVR